MTILMVKHWNIFHVFHLEIFVIIVINLNKNISPVNLMINIDLDSDSDLIPTGWYSSKKSSFCQDWMADSLPANVCKGKITTQYRLNFPKLWNSRSLSIRSTIMSRSIDGDISSSNTNVEVDAHMYASMQSYLSMWGHQVPKVTPKKSLKFPSPKTSWLAVWGDWLGRQAENEIWHNTDSVS